MSITDRFDPTICDLCGSRDSSVLLKLKTGRAMLSDRRIVPQNLVKLVCSRCGLARSGHEIDAVDLNSYYLQDYGVSVQPEHYFYTTEGPVSRSRLMAEWMRTALGSNRAAGLRRCLEIGASRGLLLQELARHVPCCSFEGLELNRDAIRLGRSAGVRLYEKTLDDFPETGYDLIFAVAVIEHVPSPQRFLAEIHRHVRPGGFLLLIQPTQDVWSYDIFFVDHLHHFGSGHLPLYAKRTGFHEVESLVSHRWMPNFSLHLWEAGDVPGQTSWEGKFVQTVCGPVATRILADMQRLDETVAALGQAGTKTAVFGLQEAYWVAHAYSHLKEMDVVCGLDDQPDRPEYAGLGFPVIKPEQSRELGVQHVILTMNPVYYEQAIPRMRALGIESHPVFS
jgi:SAM-dependent methyltransferase